MKTWSSFKQEQHTSFIGCEITGVVLQTCVRATSQRHTKTAHVLEMRRSLKDKRCPNKAHTLEMCRWRAGMATNKTVVFSNCALRFKNIAAKSQRPVKKNTLTQKKLKKLSTLKKTMMLLNCTRTSQGAPKHGLSGGGVCVRGTTS